MSTPYLKIFLAIFFALLCAYIAKNRGKNPIVWVFAGFFFTVFALLILLILPYKKEKSIKNPDLRLNLEELQELENTEEDKPELALAEEDGKIWYYLDENNTQFGPMSLDALIKTWKEGKIQKDTLVWNEDLSDWKPLKETSDFPLFGQSKN